MSSGAKVMALSGSVRAGSWNRLLLSQATSFLESQGVGTETVNLGDYELPIYNGDIESTAGVPENGVRLRTKIDQSRALLISTPEYNGSVTPILKNVIDWTSRAYEGHPPTKVYRNKIICLVSASQGDKGGLRGLSHLASVFMNMGATVMPRFFGVSFVTRALDESGDFNDPKMRKAFETYLESFAEVLRRVR